VTSLPQPEILSAAYLIASTPPRWHGYARHMGRVDERDPQRALVECPLLRGLPEDARRAFIRLATVRQLDRGEVIFDEGDPADTFLLVLSGKIKVTRPSDSGKETVFTILGPDDLLGELALFDDTARQATAVAVRPSRAAVVANADMRAWFTEHPVAMQRFAQLLAQRVRRLNDALEDVYGLDVATRVARALVLQSAQFGRRTGEGLQVDLDLNQEELALHVRASRERVNQVLADFGRRGWLRREGAGLIVMDPDALRGRARFRSEVENRRPTIG
jgi:CRP/FNR family cyclic AMP-dependent transcriptional regulator